MIKFDQKVKQISVLEAPNLSIVNCDFFNHFNKEIYSKIEQTICNCSECKFGEVPKEK